MLLLCFSRAHLKECFEMLRQQVPNLEDHKTSNLSILRSAQKCIQVGMVSVAAFHRTVTLGVVVCSEVFK